MAITTSSASSPTSRRSPLLAGIEAGAETLGCDLLLFTSAPVAADGRRELFHERNRLRLADGVLLLGVEMDPTELARLAQDDYRVVAVGRRDTPGIPFVGIDYATAARTLVHRAIALGHRNAIFLHRSSLGESVLDRRRGVAEGASDTGVVLMDHTTEGDDIDADWAAVRASGATLVISEEPELAAALMERAQREGIAVPEALSIIALGSTARPGAEGTGGIELTRLLPPREELGARAVALLARIVSEGEEVPVEDRRTLLECPIADGATLAAAGSAR